MTIAIRENDRSLKLDRCGLKRVGILRAMILDRVSEKCDRFYEKQGCWCKNLDRCSKLCDRWCKKLDRCSKRAFDEV